MAEARVGGVWRTIKLPYARVSGSWRPCKQIYTKVNGQWKIAFDLTAADPFDGSGNLSGSLTPGYVPWEGVNGSFTRSSGNAVADSTSERIAAIETGVENIEVEIDRPTAASGGTGVAFWIQDQSNWWGVRAYTEEYFVPFTNFTYYPFNCYATNWNRTVNTVPGNAIPGNYVSCYYVATQSPTAAASNTNRFTSIQTCRTCSCNGNLNNNCSFAGLSPGPNFCPGSGACSTTSFANSSCTVNTKGTFCRVSSCGSACGSCSPNTTCVTGGPFIGNSVNCPSPTTFTASSGACTCFYPTNYTNYPNFNPSPGNNAATCSCSDTQTGASNFLAFFSTNAGTPTCVNTQPCSTYNTTQFFQRTCVPCSSGCTTSFSGANAAYYKRAQVVRKVGGTFSVISNQDFGDVGNLYAYTSGNIIGFRQYSGEGRTGNSSNVQTFDAGAVSKGTKHGILVTAVPYTQSFSISRFKANL